MGSRDPDERPREGGDGMDLVNDLRYAEATGVAVELAVLDSEPIHTGVHEVNKDGGFVSVYAPQDMGDFTTTKRIPLDLITWVTVTKNSWFPSAD
jgi:hypothetical protein